MRKLASVRRIKQLSPIAGADRIETATVDGWQVVVKKGEFSVGDLCIYFEIDSWIPDSLAPFLTSAGKEPREYKGVKGQRLKTVKLRKQLSQGLILPVSGAKGLAIEEGQDLTEFLGILKWEQEEAEQPVGYQGKRVWTAKNFPTHLFPKTDQERIQNVFDLRPKDHTYELTVKLDGSSCSIFRHEGRLRVCSRNIELAIVEKDDHWLVAWFKRLVGLQPKRKTLGNHFVDMAVKLGPQIPEGYCFQGELCGPGIQDNYEKLGDFGFFVYDVVHLATREYLPAEERQLLVNNQKLFHVPVLEQHAVYPNSIEEALHLADNTPSMYNPKAEGIVYKSRKDPSLSFKAISNNYLLYKDSKGD